MSIILMVSLHYTSSSDKQDCHLTHSKQDSPPRPLPAGLSPHPSSNWTVISPTSNSDKQDSHLTQFKQELPHTLQAQTSRTVIPHTSSSSKQDSHLTHFKLKQTGQLPHTFQAQTGSYLTHFKLKQIGQLSHPLQAQTNRQLPHTLQSHKNRTVTYTIERQDSYLTVQIGQSLHTLQVQASRTVISHTSFNLRQIEHVPHTLQAQTYGSYLTLQAQTEQLLPYLTFRETGELF